MKTLIATLTLCLASAACLASASPAAKQPLAPSQNHCELPAYLLFADSPLPRVAEAVRSKKALRIAVIGTGSSLLAGNDGRSSSYPARLEAALKRRLPGVGIEVVSLAKPRQTVMEMTRTLEKLLADEKPQLVIWQTGTFDAMRGIDPGSFRESVSEGVEKLQAGGADVILVNMQYSPRTETIIATGGYADYMRWVAREREVPLFDRLAIMRYWYDTGTIDLYGGLKNAVAAKHVHDCIGRAIASMIIDAARLEGLEGKATQ